MQLQSSAKLYCLQAYAVNCSAVTVDRVYSMFDIFAAGHVMGWVVKALSLRSYVMCWAVSILWEFTEVRGKCQNLIVTYKSKTSCFKIEEILFCLLLFLHLLLFFAAPLHKSKFKCFACLPLLCQLLVPFEIVYFSDGFYGHISEFPRVLVGSNSVRCLLVQCSWNFCWNENM